MKSHRAVHALLWVLFLAFHAPSRAQVRVLTSTSGPPGILGRVIDASSEDPIPNADILLNDSANTLIATTRTDETGFFRLTPDERGMFTLAATQLGYSEATGTFDFDGTGSIVVQVSLSIDPVELEGLSATALKRRREMENTLGGFEARKARGVGTFFDEEDIRLYKPTKLTDLLRRVSGVQVVRMGGQVKDIQVTSAQTWGATGGRPCFASIWLDGIQVREGGFQDHVPGGEAHRIFFIDDAVPPEQIGGIEVYTHLGRIPPQFRNTNSVCGVIVLWSRRGGVEWTK